MTIFKQLLDKYRKASVYEQFISINVLVFAVIAILKAVLFLLFNQTTTFINYIALPNYFKAFLSQPWSLFTYMFLHTSFWHLLGNMIALYVFGQIFCIYFSSKQFVNCYMLGGLFAGLIFILSYTVFPVLIGQSAVLLGASAAIFAILFAVTTYNPNYTFNLFGVLQLKLWVIAVLYAILFITTLPSQNTGGEIAHISGAFFGFLYTRQLQKGQDIGKWFERLYSKFKLNRSTSKLKAVHKSKPKMAGYSKSEFDEFNKQKRIDLILDKISKNGYDSLSEDEKTFLFKAGK